MKYLVIDVNNIEGEATENDIEVMDFKNDGEIADYMEESFSRDILPPVLIPVSVVKKVLKG